MAIREATKNDITQGYCKDSKCAWDVYKKVFVDEVINEIEDMEVQIRGLANGSPKGTYATSTALKEANPETGVYLAEDNGHIYSWIKDSGSAPVDLGVYIATPVETDETLTESGIPADAKIVGQKLTQQGENISKNAKQLETNTNNISNLLKTTGEHTTNISNHNTEIIDLKKATRRIETDIFDSGEASGSSIHLEDSTLSEFQELAVDGTHKQEITQGYNRLNLSDSSGTQSGITTTVKNGIIHINGTATAGTSIFLIVKELVKEKMNANAPFYCYIEKSSSERIDITLDYFDGTNYTQSVVGSHMTVNTMNREITLTEDKYLRGITLYCPEGIAYNNVIVKPMITDSIQTSFESYSGGQASPNSNYEQPIEVIEGEFEVKSTGKNKLDMSNMMKTITHNGVTLTNNGDGTFNVKGTATATINFSILGNMPKNIIKSGENYNLYSSQPYDSKAFNLSIVLNTDNGVKYYVPNKVDVANFNTIDYARLVLYIPAGQTVEAENVKVALYKSDTVIDEYEPYQETKVTFEIPEGEFFGSVSDTITDEAKIVFNEEDGQYHKIIEKNIGKYVFDGSEKWALSVYAPNQEKNSYFSSDILDNKIKSDDVISNKFKTVNANIIWSVDEEGIGIDMKTGNAIRIRLSKTKATTADELKQCLSEDNLILFYALKESYAIDLGIVDMPLSYYPVTNVSSNHELQPVINVKYYRDIKNTITSMQTDIEALKQAVSTLSTNQVNLSSEVDFLQEQVSESEVVE